MDKELLRIIIMATGLLIIAGILSWSYFKNKQTDESSFDDEPLFRRPRKEQPLAENDDDEDIDIVPVSTKANPYYDEDEDDIDDEELIELSPARPVAPEIIQFSVVARAEEGFKGTDLVSTFETIGLTYGKLKIFERLDVNRLVDFGVASMVAPGTFPSHHLEDYHCPGVVFFMQPSLLDDAVTVFDNMIQAIDVLATDLDAVVWDADRKLLTAAKMKALRQSL
jgi:cell division protein ZipA